MGRSSNSWWRPRFLPPSPGPVSGPLLGFLLGMVVACGQVDRRGATPDAGAAQRDAAVGERLDGATSSVIGDHPVPGLCHRDGDDVVRDAFCGERAVGIEDLATLYRALQLAPNPNDIDAVSAARGTDTNVVLTGHSTSLSGHLVSPINPRAIVQGTHVVLAFQRGVQQVELAAVARARGGFNFYLLTFRQACNESAAGCIAGDLYTPAIERGWRDIALQDDEDLANTRFDCRQCHQRGLARPVLLMRELNAPWTHFFGPPEGAGLPGVRGGELVQDYLAAKGDEAYAGIPTGVLVSGLALSLQIIMSVPQPLVFDSPTIIAERFPEGAEGASEAPRRSPTWDRAFAAFKRGEQLALPYFAARATDPDKQARLGEAYRRYLNGELARDELPDLSDIHPDDPQVRAEIGLQTEPDATPAEILIQACGACHNDVLDQGISRARFSIALSRMDRAARERAIERVELAADAEGAMPPPEARQLDAGARDRLVAYLRRGERPADEDAMLEAAAVAGMAGDGAR